MITITWHIIKSSSLPSSLYYRWKLGLSMNLRTFPILFIPFQIFMFFFFNVTVAAAFCVCFLRFSFNGSVCVSLSLSPVNVWKSLNICVCLFVCLPGCLHSKGYQITLQTIIIITMVPWFVCAMIMYAWPFTSSALLLTKMATMMTNTKCDVYYQIENEQSKCGKRQVTLMDCGSPSLSVNTQSCPRIFDENN